jgi:hypothetical protein
MTPTAQSDFPAIPGYQIEALAGRGGMGAVYRARQIATGRQIALKLLSSQAPNAATLDAFRREAELIAGLEHPHILPVYDFGEERGIPYLVMRYLPGSLADQLRAGPVSLDTAVRWLSRLADALDFAHQKGIVHKDVKPSNALLDDAGQVYLTDFGIAGAMQAVGDGVPLGSAAYMSPEQCRGEAVDARADVYALTIMLFEMLTGQKPYTAETALGIMARQIHDPIPSPRALNPAIPPAVEALIVQGMAKDNAKRPASAAEFARLLVEAVAAPAPPPVILPEPAAAKPGRSRLWWGLIGFLLLATCLAISLVLTGGGLWLAAADTATPPPTATRPSRPVTPTPTAPPPGELLREDFTRAASGFATGSDADGGVAYQENALEITALTSGVEWFSPSSRVDAADVRITLSVQPTAVTGSGYLGLICRWQDADNYTLLALSGAGETAIWQKRAGVTSILADWETSSITIAAGQSIQLHGVCHGRQLQLLANEMLLIQAEDPAPASGDIALMAGLRDDGEWQVRFTDLRVVEP